MRVISSVEVSTVTGGNGDPPAAVEADTQTQIFDDGTSLTTYVSGGGVVSWTDTSGASFNAPAVSPTVSDFFSGLAASLAIAVAPSVAAATVIGLGALAYGTKPRK